MSLDNIEKMLDKKEVDKQKDMLKIESIADKYIDSGVPAKVAVSEMEKITADISSQIQKELMPYMVEKFTDIQRMKMEVISKLSDSFDSIIDEGDLVKLKTINEMAKTLGIVDEELTEMIKRFAPIQKKDDGYGF